MVYILSPTVFARYALYIIFVFYILLVQLV